MDLIKLKIEQAVDILDELNIDLWLIFCRETAMMADPALDLVVGHKVVWQSAFFIPRDGETTALVGNYDVANLERSGRFRRVAPYVEDCGREIRALIEQFDPNRIALNYSLNDPAADGLSYGMHQLLLKYLEGTPYIERIISSEKLVSLLRGRKLRDEIGRISTAAILASDCWHKSLDEIRPGMSEIEIAEVISTNIEELGAVISFETIANAGDKTDPGHGCPTDAVLEPGDLLHVDFGARFNGYCSDIQRLAYCRNGDQAAPPGDLIKAFTAVREIIDEVSKLYKPGMKGYEIDAVARRRLHERGYPEYQHALGHQIGRSVHDGAAIVGPNWPRYGTTPKIPLEEGNVFTIEFGISLPGIGYVGLEEDLAVTESGGRFLCPRQTELTIL
ncbi:MAG: aminopeptidase P family protein [Candidatus Zixiibacteriota bacterium]|nr:MAG: aminopeptidase P family protein [candidate division Zixibacteria bacterium]